MNIRPMEARLKPAMLLPVAFAALLAAPVASATPSDSAPAPAAAADSLFVKLQIETDGKKLEHPGHKMESGEELVLVLNEGKKKHEAVVFIEATDGGFTVEVTYSTGGSEKLKGSQTAKADSWVTFKSDDGKSKVKVLVQSGAKRKDGIKIDGGDNPLDGLE